jgi:hypothetical protein
MSRVSTPRTDYSTHLGRFHGTVRSRAERKWGRLNILEHWLGGRCGTPGEVVVPVNAGQYPSVSRGESLVHSRTSLALLTVGIQERGSLGRGQGRPGRDPGGGGKAQLGSARHHRTPLKPGAGQWRPSDNTIPACSVPMATPKRPPTVGCRQNPSTQWQRVSLRLHFPRHWSRFPTLLLPQPRRENPC